MINRTGFVGISCTVTSAAGAKADASNLRFEKLLTEKRADGLEIGDNAFAEEIMEHILKSIASMSEGSKSIWEIVLQLENHVDPKLLDENYDVDFDDTAGLNSVAALLARFWKKKELLEENDTAFSYFRDHNAIDTKAVSELTVLLRKKKHRLIAEVRE